jgi:hypothetical protein
MVNQRKFSGRHLTWPVFLVLLVVISVLMSTPVSAADPSITTVTPASGPVEGGTTVTITGDHFGGTQGSGYVKIGDTAVTTYIAWSNSQIVVIAPAHVAGIVAILVYANNGKDDTRANAFTYYAHPQSGTVNDGMGEDIDEQTSLTTINANWSGFSDPQSGITGYEWAIGNTSGGTDIMGYTGVGLSTSASSSGLTLVNNTRYYVSVRATNGGGLTCTATSDGVLVGAPPPLPEVPAGLMLGGGLLAIGGFLIFRKSRAASH